MIGFAADVVASSFCSRVAFEEVRTAHDVVSLFDLVDLIVKVPQFVSCQFLVHGPTFA